MAATKILGAGVLNHLFREAATPRQNSYWLALYTSATNSDGDGDEVDTDDWSNYERFELTAETANTLFAAAAEIGGNRMAVANTAMIEIVGSATLVNPVTVSHAAVMSASTDGDMLLEASLNAPVAIQNGQPVRIPVGQLLSSL